MKTTYNARGFCLGNYWGGGAGSYPTKNYKSDNLEGLRTMIKNAIDDGSIDSGMGFESMIGAAIAITKIITTTLTVDGKQLEFKHESTNIEYFGNLNDDQTEFLAETVMYDL